MANQPETGAWASVVYQWETSDPAQGGVGGVMNAPILQLANRTGWLKGQVDALNASVGSSAGLASPAFTGNPTCPTAPQFDDDTTIANTHFVRRALGSFSGNDGYGTSFTLDATHVGRMVGFWGSADGTWVVPLSSTVPDGGACILKNFTTHLLTIQTQGPDTFIASGVAITSFQLGPNDWAVLVSGGASTNQWLIHEGTSALRYSYTWGLKADTSGTYPSMSVGSATNAGNAGTVGGWNAAGLLSWTNHTNKPTTLSGYGITDAQSALGYTPVQQGTGPNQNASLIKIGWSASGFGNWLRLQVDASDFGNTWPINVSGQAASASVADRLSGSPGSPPHYSCRAWVSFNGGGSGDLRRGSGNVSSITHNGTGDFTINFSTAMPDANYAMHGTTGGLPNADVVKLFDGYAPDVWSVRINTFKPGALYPSIDPPYVFVSIFR